MSTAGQMPASVETPTGLYPAQSGSRESEMRLGQPSGTAAGLGTSAEGMAQQVKGKMRDVTETVQHSVKPTVEQYFPNTTKASVEAAARDTRHLVSLHPVFVPLLIFLCFLLGFTLGSMSGNVFGTKAYSQNYNRGSPEYEAHKKLDNILQSIYGRHGFKEKLGFGGGGRGRYDTDSGSMLPSLWGGEKQRSDEGFLEKYGLSGGSSTEPSQSRRGWFGGGHESSQVDEALSYMGDTLKNMKERMSPSREERGGISNYLSEHLPSVLGGRSEDYQYQHPQRSFFDKLKGYYSKSDWEKVDEAEHRLREALEAAAKRGEL